MQDHGIAPYHRATCGSICTPDSARNSVCKLLSLFVLSTFDRDISFNELTSLPKGIFDNNDLLESLYDCGRILRRLIVIRDISGNPLGPSIPLPVRSVPSLKILFLEVFTVFFIVDV
jgi:hypothetical protein